MTSLSSILIAIDPGASGGIASIGRDGRLTLTKMPETPADILGYMIGFSTSSLAYIEKVGSSRPGNAAKAMTTFARHCGHLEMALLAARIPAKEVTPQKWMKWLGIPPGLELKDRKNRIKAAMQKRWPSVTVTLWNADALAILTYAMDREARP